MEIMKNLHCCRCAAFCVRWESLRGVLNPIVRSNFRSTCESVIKNDSLPCGVALARALRDRGAMPLMGCSPELEWGRAFASLQGTPQSFFSSANIAGSCFFNSSRVNGKKSFREKYASEVSAKYSCGVVIA